MPGGFPLGLEVCGGTSAGAVLTTTLPTTLNTTVINTKGAYSQLVASTAADTCFIEIDIFGWGSAASLGAVDIAVGAAGSEQVIINNLVLSDSTASASAHYAFPVAIPAGTRISARAQSNVTATNTTFCSVILFDGAFTQNEGYGGVNSIGFNAGGSGGTGIDPGAVANTKSAYVQLTASTTVDFMGLVVNADISTSTTSASFPSWFVDIAIGAAASEKDIIPNIFFLSVGAGAANIVTPCSPLVLIPVPIPSGTRISARAQCGVTTATARLIGITCYGILQ